MFNTFIPELSVFKEDVIKMFIKDNISAGRYRKYAWKISLVLIFARPIIGYGPECMNLGIKSINMGNYDYFASNLNRAHNEYLNTMVSSGIFAGSAQVLLIITSLVKGINNKEFNYKLAFTCSVMAYFVQANFSSSVISVIPIFWIFMAIILKE